jgi:cytoskeletal protein CcmA (bactofilin family)
MMRRSCLALFRGRAFLLALLLTTGPAVALAQAVSQVAPDTVSQPEPSLAELRDRVEARYQLLPLRGGIALLPKYGDTDVQSVELSDGQIAINGAPVTGAELDQRVGPDAADIRRLSFMESDARRVLFGIGPSPATAEGVVPDTTAADTTLVEEEDYENEEGIDVGGSGDRVRVGAGIRVAEGELIEGDVVAVGGSVHIDGTVEGDVVAVGGGVHLGSNAVVDGDVTSVGGTIDREPGAVIHGTVDEVAFGAPHIAWGADWGPGPFFAGVTGLIGTIVWITILLLLVCLAYLFARRPIERMEYRVGTSAWKAALVGLVAQLLFIPALVLTCVVLAISIIGIPFLLLVPFAVLALVIGALLGFTAVAKRLGHTAEDRFGWRHANPYLSIVIGVGLIMMMSFFGNALGVVGGPLKVFGAVLTILGIIAQYVAWTIGLGVLLLTRFGTRYRWSDGETPEPVPAPPPPVPATHGGPGAPPPPPGV